MSFTVQFCSSKPKESRNVISGKPHLPTLIQIALAHSFKPLLTEACFWQVSFLCPDCLKLPTLSLLINIRVLTISDIVLPSSAANIFLWVGAKPSFCSETQRIAENLRETRSGSFSFWGSTANLQEECCAEGCNTEEIDEVTFGDEKIVRYPIYSLFWQGQLKLINPIKPN